MLCACFSTLSLVGLRVVVVVVVVVDDDDDVVVSAFREQTFPSWHGAAQR